jgi:hypothetical protein
MRDRERRKLRSSSWPRQYRLADVVRSTSALDAAVILLKAIIQITVGPMPHRLAELHPDRPGIGVVAVCCHSVRGDAGDRLGRAKEGLCRGEVAMFAEHYVDQGAIAIDRAIQIHPASVHPDIRLVDVPTPAYFALSSPPEILGQCRRELRLPIANGLVAEHKAADQEHLGQITQTEFVAEPPEHHESDHVTRVLRPVQQTGATLVELLRAIEAAEPAIALRRALGPFPDRCRPASWATHPARPLQRTRA